jgi:hypothetical protein
MVPNFGTMSDKLPLKLARRVLTVPFRYEERVDRFPQTPRATQPKLVLVALRPHDAFLQTTKKGRCN